MEILLWLVPSVVVTVLAMLWVGWMGRDRADDVDRDAAVARLAHALEHGRPVHTDHRPERRHDRSRGIAVRPSRLGATGDQRRAG